MVNSGLRPLDCFLSLKASAPRTASRLGMAETSVKSLAPSERKLNHRHDLWKELAICRIVPLSEHLEEAPVRRSTLPLAVIFAAGAAAAVEPIGSSLSIPIPDAERGRKLFVQKACVVCHSVNGVGGTIGPALDATEPAGVFDPLDFAARIWQGAAAMVALQEAELGYQIELTGGDIADLAAFAESHTEQGMFREDAIPEVMRGWTVDDQDRMYLEPMEEN